MRRKRRPILGVVPAKAGTHNHRIEFGEDWWLPVSRHNHSLGLMVWTAPYGIRCARMRLSKTHSQEPSVSQIIRIGMDTSKHIFQLHGVDASEQVVLRKRLHRNAMLAFFAKLAPTVVAIEACGAAHFESPVVSR